MYTFSGDKVPSSHMLAGWLLGSLVGIGTLISTFGAGAVMQAVYNIIRFESRNVKHRSVVEITHALLHSTT